VDTKVCVVCGSTFTRRPRERPASFATRKRCGFYCRPVNDPDKVGRQRAEAAYPAEQPCEVCGKTGKGRGVIDRHHRNSDRLDNSPENIAFLCRKHHNAAHRLTDGKIGGGPRPRVAAMMHDRTVVRAREAAALRDAGVSIPEIARRMGVDSWSVHRWFRKYGL